MTSGRWEERVYGVLLRLYPVAFRRAYAQEMMRTFRDQCRAVRAAPRALAVTTIFGSLVDLVRGAWQERVGTGDPVHRGGSRGRRRPSFRRRVPLTRLHDELRDAWRAFRRRPGLSLAAVGTLALGIGANTSILTVFHGVVLQPLPYPGPDELVAVQRIRPNGLVGELGWQDVVRIREEAITVRQVVGYSVSAADLGGVVEPARLDVARVTAGFFDVFAMTPAQGRLLAPDDHGPDGKRVAVVGYATWMQRFGADPAVIGRSIRLNDERYQVVGVLAPNHAPFPAPDIEFWIPTSENFGHGAFWLSGVGRLADGVTLARAQAELNVIARRLAEEHPELYTGREFLVRGLRQHMVGDVRSMLAILLGAVGLVLLIATANVANLTLVGTADRYRELALRGALGASRGRLVRQLLSESLLLAAVGTAVGILVARWTTAALLALGPADLPRRTEIGIDWSVLLSTFGVALTVGGVIGLLPAWSLPSGRLHDVLRGGPVWVGRDRSRIDVRRVLVAAQVALSCILLIGAGLLTKSLWRLLQIDPGFRVENALVFRVSTPPSAYPDRADVARVHGSIRESLAALPGVGEVASVSLVPFDGGNWCNELVLENHEGGIGCAEFRNASPEYFRVMGLGLVGGRVFDERDDAAAVRVAVIDEAAAREGWGDRDPVGQRFAMFDEWWEVIGVVRAVRQFGLDRAPVATVYMPQSQIPLRYARYVIRTAGVDPGSLVSAVRRRVREVDRRLPLSEFGTLAALVEHSVAQPRFRTVLVGSMAGLALILSTVGLFGVLAVSVTRQTREIGLRMALGANRSRVAADIVAQGAGLVLIGAVIGLVGAVVTVRVLGSFLFGVTVTDPVVFAVGFLTVGLGGLVAGYLPARRAMRIDPMIALRHE